MLDHKKTPRHSILKPREDNETFTEMYINKQKKIIQKLSAGVTDTFVDFKDIKLSVELPFDKKNLYEDLSNMYYGDVFSNSPKTELERLQNRKNKLKL
jgi:hypothetical protein|tara:strand:+ start:693 stop:986 length:294 start_codon:yes stop_codon:yes gene_type:complete